MKREECNRYEMESVLRAGVTLNRRGPGGDDTAQKLIGNSERRKAKRKQKEGVA